MKKIRKLLNKFYNPNQSVIGVGVKIKIALSFIILVGIMLLSGCGCKQVNPKQYNLKLEIWGLFDNQEAWKDVIENYKKINPNISDVRYKKLAVDTYKKDMLDALASGQGPDIFLIGNNWLPSFKDKIIPVPPGILSEQKFRNDFVDVVAADFLDKGQIYAVPLFVDSIALYYNKDLFNEAGITAPPANWNDFMDDVRKLTRVDNQGNILRSGAAIGTAQNINRSTDILNLLMMQNGTAMVDPVSKRAIFDQVARDGDQSIFPGENALKFYAQFAKVGSSIYCWNPRMHYSIDAFSEGATAMMFNYSWQMAAVDAKAPKLNYAVAPVPQLPNMPAVNYANYWGFAVAKNKATDPRQPQITNDIRAAESWKFLAFLTTRPTSAINISTNVAGQQKTTAANFDPALNYLQKTQKPAARRDLVEAQKTDARLGVFAAQNLVAKSWYESDPEAIENIFAQMIDAVNRGASTPADAIRAAAQQISNLMNR